MIEKYYNFDVDRFLADHTEHITRLAELKAEKQAVADSGGMEYGHIRGSGISDPTARRAQKRESIDWKIKEYEECIRGYDKLTADLTEEEKMMIEYLSIRKGSANRRSAFITLSEALGYSESNLYALLNELRQKLRKIADFGA